MKKEILILMLGREIKMDLLLAIFIVGAFTALLLMLLKYISDNHWGC